MLYLLPSQEGVASLIVVETDSSDDVLDWDDNRLAYLILSGRLLEELLGLMVMMESRVVCKLEKKRKSIVDLLIC